MADSLWPVRWRRIRRTGPATRPGVSPSATATSRSSSRASRTPPAATISATGQKSGLRTIGIRLTGDARRKATDAIPAGHQAHTQKQRMQSARSGPMPVSQELPGAEHCPRDEEFPTQHRDHHGSPGLEPCVVLRAISFDRGEMLVAPASRPRLCVCSIRARARWAHRIVRSGREREAHSAPLSIAAGSSARCGRRLPTAPAW